MHNISTKATIIILNMNHHITDITFITSSSSLSSSSSSSLPSQSYHILGKGDTTTFTPRLSQSLTRNAGTNSIPTSTSIVTGVYEITTAVVVVATNISNFTIAIFLAITIFICISTTTTTK